MNPECQSPDSGSPTSVRGVVLSDADGSDVRRQKMARIILDSMYQFLGLLDTDGTVLEINQAALDGAGLTLADVIGKPFWQTHWWAVSDEAREQVRLMILQARQGQFVRADFEVYGADDGQRTIYIDFSLTPIRDDSGAVVFLLPEGRNITEKIAMEAELTRRNGELQSTLEKLREIDGFKTKFFANVSHELRTPLTLILGPAEQMLRDPALTSERDRFRLGTIKHNAQSLLQQVNDLLDLARLDSGQMPLAYVRAQIPAIVRHVTEGFVAMAEERGIQFRILADEDFTADIDRAKFIRILVNLLSNAFKFIQDGGRIVCSVSLVSGQRFLISVQDNGPGVSDALKQQIFDRFARAPEQAGAIGSGLGLNIVKEFVELQGGAVVVLDAPGGGAVFQVELPLYAPVGCLVRDGRQAAADSAFPLAERYLSGPGQGLQRRTAGPPGGRNRILVVEDNQDLQLFLYDVLIDEYDVTLVDDGRMGLEAALAAPPDLIITDLMMPEVDGEAFIRAFRQQGGGHAAGIPVLVLSARGDETLRETLLDRLVQDYLTKPFSPQELRARVRNLIAVKCTADLLRRELNSQASDICSLTNSLIDSRKSLQDSVQALQLSERRWMGVYDTTAVGIALADLQGRIIQANPALQRMLGYEGDDITGVSLIDITEAPMRAVTRRHVDELLAGLRDHYQLEKRYEKKGGGALWAVVSASLIPATGTDGPQLAVIVEDVSARKQAEAALETTRDELVRVARFTAMGELAGSIAHDINQPLAAVITNCLAAQRWLGRGADHLAEVGAALRRVERDAGMAQAVIDRITRFLRGGEIQRGPVDGWRLVVEMLAMMQAALAAAEIRTELQGEAADVTFCGDGVQIRQVLMNLILNAIDAMQAVPPADRRLQITLRADPQQGTLFLLRDSGPGISAAVRERIFDPLYTTKSSGLGMGLAICRRIVENHGGALWLESPAPGGACFCFIIPPEERCGGSGQNGGSGRRAEGQS